MDKMEADIIKMVDYHNENDWQRARDSGRVKLASLSDVIQAG